MDVEGCMGSRRYGKLFSTGFRRGSVRLVRFLMVLCVLKHACITERSAEDPSGVFNIFGFG